MISQQELRLRFSPPLGQDFEPALQALLLAAQSLNESCPAFWETERAMEKLQECRFWAAAALDRARREGLLATKGRGAGYTGV